MLPKPTISSLVAATPFAIELKDTQDNAKTKAGDSLVVFRIDDLLHPVLHHGESYLVDVMLAASVLRSTPAYLIGHRKAVALAFAHSPDRQANTSKPFHFCHALASPKHHLDARIWAEKVLELMSLRCVAGYYVGYIVPVDWKTICELRPPTSTGPTEAPTKLHLLLDREDTLPREKQVSATGPNKATASRSSKSSSSINKGKKAVKPTKSKRREHLLRGSAYCF